MVMCQSLVQLRKTQVIADREPNTSEWRVAGDQTVPWNGEAALHQEGAVRDIHVEEVHLAVSGSNGPLAVDHHVGVEPVVSQDGRGRGSSPFQQEVSHVSRLLQVFLVRALPILLHMGARPIQPAPTIIRRRGANGTETISL